MPWDVAFLSVGDALDATPVEVSKGAFLEAFEEHRVVVFPGFLGRARDGQPQVLGRGGSDLTALFLAAELGADQCILLKSAAGLYEWDPLRPGPRPRRYTRISWDDAMNLGGRVLRPTDVEYARSRSVTFEVTSLATADSSAVGAETSEFAPPAIEPSERELPE